MEKTKVKVNPLPSVTWHWLGMNESELDIAMPSFAPALSLGGEERELRWINGIGTEAFRALGRNYKALVWSGWEQMETGMGGEFARILSGKPAAFLDIPAGYRAKGPALITVSPRDGGGAGRIFINAGEGSEACVVIAAGRSEAGNVTASAAAHNEDAVALQLKIHAQADAHLKIFVVQTLPMEAVSCVDTGGVCEERAEVEFTQLSLGSGKAYTGTAMALQGEESSFLGDMGYRVRPGQKVDINYVARHAGSRSQSRMNAWGVLEDDSRKLFRGTIDFHTGCAGSKGMEKEDVLLLGGHQVNRTIPLILCHEEDVEGDHGATISRLDDDVLFYLGTRGVEPKTAENMIARARLEALCSRIPDADIRAEAEKLIGPVEKYTGPSGTDGGTDP